MNLDLVNDLLNNVKENKVVQNFIKELSNYIENNDKGNNLFSEDLTLYGNKIIAKYRDEILTERNNILQDYAKQTKEKGEMIYIYDINTNEKNAYNLCSCESNEIITKQIKELPEGVNLGSVLRKENEELTLDIESTKDIENEINNMIKEKIEEQNKYLDSKRIEGHTYEVGEKYFGRIWLYDLDNVRDEGMEGIEEIEFPKDLYEDAEEGDVFIYQNGEYQKK